METTTMKSDRPLVGIGLPVFNGEGHLEEALDSILVQTYSNFELIIVDNASTDGTPEICRAYAARDKRIRYYRNPVNVGLQGNFPLALKLSSAKYFMWTAADDIRPTTAVEDCLEALLNNDQAVMAHGSLLLKIEGQEELIELSHKLPGCDSLNSAERVRAYVNGVKHNVMFYGMYKRDIAARGILGWHYGYDYTYNLQTCFLGPLAYIQKPMLIYRHKKHINVGDPTYKELNLTLMNLLKVGTLKRRKCWVILLTGCYYLARTGDARMAERLRAIAAYISAIVRRYRSRLSKEIVFQLFAPVALLLYEIPFRLTHRWPICLRVVQKLRRA